MKEVTHKALGMVETHINAQMDALGSAYVGLRERFNVPKISSVFLCYAEPEKSTNTNGHLAVAMVVLTELDPSKMHAELAAIEAQHPRSLKLHLMAFDDVTLMTPGLTLPHPELHVTPQWLVPCVEVWGQYVHPVLGQSLGELSAAEDWGNWGQFFAQGESLVEFYSKRRK